MDDSYNHLPKDDPKVLEKHYVYKVPALHFWLFWFLQTPLNSLVKLHFLRMRFHQNTFTGNRSTPMKTCSKSKGRHASSLKRTQTALRKPDKTLIKLVLFHRFAPAAETLINPYETHVISSPPARAARRKTLGLEPIPEGEIIPERICQWLFFSCTSGRDLLIIENTK